MPWDNRLQKQRAITEVNNAYGYESPFPNYEELENNKNLIKKFSFNGNDTLNLGIADVDFSQIDGLFKKYLDEWNPSSKSENYKFTKNPQFNLSYPEFDAFVLYCFIREKRPNKIIEIGSGESTKVMIEAVTKNNNGCEITCIEPYNDTISNLTAVYPVKVIKDKVENVDLDLFKTLKENDILFIDSTHVFKPFGDVEYEYLHILPIINTGCIVHVHDIFYPFDYPEIWTFDWRCVLTEQQFLISFLYGNNLWKSICPNHYILKSKSDIVPEKIEFRHGGSYWMKKL